MEPDLTPWDSRTSEVSNYHLSPVTRGEHRSSRTSKIRHAERSPRRRICWHQWASSGGHSHASYGAPRRSPLRGHHIRREPVASAWRRSHEAGQARSRPAHPHPVTDRCAREDISLRHNRCTEGFAGVHEVALVWCCHAPSRHPSRTKNPQRGHQVPVDLVRPPCRAASAPTLALSILAEQPGANQTAAVLRP